MLRPLTIAVALVAMLPCVLVAQEGLQSIPALERRVTDRANLLSDVQESALEEKLAGAAAQAVQPEVHLRPNKLAEYKEVAMVMAAAQRLGVTKLGLVGNEQFVN